MLFVILALLYLLVDGALALLCLVAPFLVLIFIWAPILTFIVGGLFGKGTPLMNMSASSARLRGWVPEKMQTPRV